MPEQKIKYVVKKKNEKTYWCDKKNCFIPEINNAKRYSEDEQISSSEELVAIYPEGKLVVIR